MRSLVLPTALAVGLSLLLSAGHAAAQTDRKFFHGNQCQSDDEDDTVVTQTSQGMVFSGIGDAQCPITRDITNTTTAYYYLYAYVVDQNASNNITCQSFATYHGTGSVSWGGSANSSGNSATPQSLSLSPPSLSVAGASLSFTCDMWSSTRIIGYLFDE